MKKVLIVEDTEDHLQIIKLILEQYNYLILTATNGKEGLLSAQNQLPDLILLDVMLPELNGYEVCKIIKHDQTTKHIPVIMLSVRSSQEDIDAGLNAGADEYMTKPFNLDELLSKVKKYLGEG